MLLRKLLKLGGSERFALNPALAELQRGWGANLDGIIGPDFEANPGLVLVFGAVPAGAADFWRSERPLMLPGKSPGSVRAPSRRWVCIFGYHIPEN